MPRGKRVAATEPEHALSPAPNAALSRYVVPVAPIPNASDWAAMRDIANTLAKTEFVPRNMQHRPDAVLAAILYGRSLNLHASQALQQIAVINGRPTMSAELMMAKIREAGHSIVISAESDEAVTITARRADTGDMHTETWSIEQAKQAGLTGKDNWKQYPKAMLRARAISATARLLFPDALLGISYTPEEAQSIRAVEVIEGNGSAAEPAPAATTGPEISDAQRRAVTMLGNGLERKWPAGKYRARFEANGNDFDAMFNELVAEHLVEHGPEDCTHVKAARALLEGSEAT